MDEIGYEWLRVIPVSQGNKCFIACPFGQDASDIVNCVVVTVGQAGLTAFCAKQQPTHSQFLKTIAEETRTSKIVIAVLNHPSHPEANVNVMYELGLAHALGKPTIVIADSQQSLPANMEGFTFVSYICPQVQRFVADDFSARLLKAILQKDPCEPHVHYDDAYLRHNDRAVEVFYDGLEPAVWWGLNILVAFDGNLATLAPLSEPLHTLTFIRPGHQQYGEAIGLLHERSVLDQAFSEVTEKKVKIAKEDIASISGLLTGYQGRNEDVRHELQQALGRQRNLGGLIQECAKKHKDVLNTITSSLHRRNASVADFRYGYGEIKNIHALFSQVISESSGYLKHVTRVRALLKGRYQSDLERHAP